MQRGAIILCGGRSDRMGRDKALLPFGAGEVMLQRVVRLVSEAVPGQRIVCVAAPGQALPPLPVAVKVASDPIPHAGPLAGLAAGMAKLPTAVEAVFVTGCDMPLLRPDLVQRMFDLLGDEHIAAPHDGRRWHPLAGVYRSQIRHQLDALLSAGECRLIALLESSRTRRVTADELRDVDPELESLATCNTLEEYRNALRAAGVSMDQ